MTFTVTRASPGTAAAPASVRQRYGFETAIRGALVAGIAIQIAQRFLATGLELSEYGRSLWYVTYEFGFVRRGLAGELLRQVLGATPSLRAVDLVQNIVALVTLGIVSALVVVLCRQRTVIAYATAALLVVAPFGFDSIGGQRRPDLIGFLLLAAIGIWTATRRSRALVLGVVAGGLLAISALVSEVSPLIVGPWLVLVVAASARAEGRSRSQVWLAMFAAGAPSVMVLGALATAGRAGTETVTALERAAPPEISGHGSIFSYLGDTFGGSVARVIEGPTRLALSIVVGALLGALLLFCARAGLPYARASFHWILPTKGIRVAWVVGTAGSSALLFALGLDWLRWITSFGFAALLATGAIVALTNRSPVGPPGREAWQRTVPLHPSFSIPALLSFVVATYLLLLPPLPNWIRSFESGVALLLDVPR